MDFLIKFFTTNTGEIELKKIIVTIIVAIITSSVSILISVITTLINSNRNKKTTYINSITSNRIKWMQDFKGFVDCFIRKTQVGYFFPIYKNLKEQIQYFEELSSIRNKIFLHLNYKGYLDDKIMTAINNIYYRIEMIYEIEALLKLDDSNDKLKYLFKHYHKDIFNQLLELVDVDLGYRNQIIKSLENSNEVPAVLQEAINKQIIQFNDKFRTAPRKIALEVQNLHNRLVMFVQIYLKLEWDRVKDESISKLKSHSQEKYKELADKMVEEYSLKLYDYSHDKLPAYIR